MPNVRTLLAAGVVAAFAAAAPAQTPPTGSSPTAPVEASVPADEPAAKAAPVVVFKPADPWIMRVPVVYWAGLLAVVVLALFVIRWRQSGEIPGPPAGP